MTSFEDELKHTLRRTDPPAGFAERVLARVANQNQPQASRPRLSTWLNLFARPMIRWASAVAVSAALIVGGLFYRQVQSEKAERERAAGEAAKQRLILALRIASSKLQLAKAKVDETTRVQTVKE